MRIVKVQWLAALFVVCLLIFSPGVQAQQRKQVTLEDVWMRYSFYQRSVSGLNWFKDGRFYTVMAKGRGGTSILRNDVTTGKTVDTLFNAALVQWPSGVKDPEVSEYAVTADAGTFLLTTESEPIYRRSYKATYYLYSPRTRQAKPLSTGGPQSYATFSPDGNKVAFVRGNNLFMTDVASGQETQITRDGQFNKIINGSADWVYEEEFQFARGFFWSTDSKKIAFYTFNETEVPEYNMQLWEGLYPTDYRFKYPKAGEANSVVSINIYHLDGGRTVPVDLGPEKDQYIPRILWTQDANLLSVRRMNRLQNRQEILHVNAATGKANVVLKEEAPDYIDVHDHLVYLKDGKHFLFASELNGFNHLFLYDVSGKLVRQITKGNWEVAEISGIDEANKLIYFTSTETSPLDRQLYVIDFNGGKKRQLTTGAGTHSIDMAQDCSYFADNYTDINSPARVAIFDRNGKELRVIEENRALRDRLNGYAISKAEFFKIKGAAGDDLNGWMIKPQDFDPNKKYPVLMFVYGGPGHQTVTNSWHGQDYFWYQVLAQKGYIIVSVDARGTGARGNKFKKSTYANLGKYESDDQIAVAKNLASYGYVDASRIGIWGWSFGGYLTALCMVKGDGIFKAGISVAPVTNWRFYDSIYTERFLKRPQDNAEGYDKNSPLNFAANLKGNYLLVHGTGDDNVHFQNAVEWQDKLIAANKQFESFYYPNRNHGIYGGVTRYHLYNMMTDFLTRKL